MDGTYTPHVRDENLRLLFAQQSSDHLAQHRADVRMKLRRVGLYVLASLVGAGAGCLGLVFHAVWLPATVWTALFLQAPLVLVLGAGQGGVLIRRRLALARMQDDLDALLRKYDRVGTLQPWPRKS